MTGRERRLLRMLCMTAGSGGGGGGDDDGGDKPFGELTWDQVIASTKTGKYKTFTVGAMKELDLGTEGVIHMQIVGIDADDLADGSGKAPLTFISKELLKTSHRMNPARTPSSAPYNEGTGSIGGWEKCEIRTYLKETVKPLIPENVRSAIKTVTKYSNICNVAGTNVMNITSEDDLWVPSYREINGTNNYETSGVMYTDLFSSTSARQKQKVGGTVNLDWWMRTAGTSGSFRIITNRSSGSNLDSKNNYPFPLGFCL